jgi:hypothetical protein
MIKNLLVSENIKSIDILEILLFFNPHFSYQSKKHIGLKTGFSGPCGCLGGVFG